MNAPAANEKVAVIVFHGIGQQVPYQTIDSVVRVLPGVDVDGASVELADIGMGKAQPRARLELTHGVEKREVHVYEGYWAPLTAGKIGLAGVFAFLLGSALSGLVHCLISFNFKRWMFGGWQSFRVQSWSWLWLAISAVFVASLWIMLAVIAVTTFAVGLHFVLPNAAPGTSGLPTPAFTAHVTAVLAVFVTVVGSSVLAAAITYWWHLHRSVRTEVSKKVLYASGPIRLLPWLTIGATIWMGVSLIGAAWNEIASIHGLTHLVWNPGWAAYAWNLTLPPTARCAWAIWSVALLAFFGLRWFLVEFCGDAAIYITAHTVSEYWSTREEIATKMHELVAAIYALKDQSKKFVYDRVVIAGHSLGSMIAYDTLNRILLEEGNGMHDYRARERTAGLLTFGAPLEKTAFIFRNQLWHEFKLRERLAAHRQPLIDRAAWREPLRWINLHAPADWVSSKLRYYDPQVPQWWKVDNREDEYSATYLFPISHVTYWKSFRLGECLRDLIFRQRLAAAAPGTHPVRGSSTDPDFVIGVAAAAAIAIAIGLLLAR